MAWAPVYASVEELRAYMGVTSDRDDVVHLAAVTAASRTIDRACNRQFGLVAAPESRYYTAEWDKRRQRWVVPVDDLMTSVGLIVTVDTADDGTYGDMVTEYQLKPVNGAAIGRPWTEIVVHPTSDIQPACLEDGVEVLARWGWTTVPDAIKQACLLQASRIAMRKDSPFGVAGSPQAGSELRLLAKIDPDVEVIIRSYRKVWGVV